MKNNLLGKSIPYLVVFHPSTQVQLSGNNIQSNRSGKEESEWMAQVWAYLGFGVGLDLRKADSTPISGNWHNEMPT